MRPGNCSGSYSEPPRAREIALRSSSCPREVDATTFSIRNFTMGNASGAGVAQTAPLGGQPDAGGALYASVRPRALSGDPNGLSATRPAKVHEGVPNPDAHGPREPALRPRRPPGRDDVHLHHDPPRRPRLRTPDPGPAEPHQGVHRG